MILKSNIIVSYLDRYLLIQVRPSQVLDFKIGRKAPKMLKESHGKFPENSKIRHSPPKSKQEKYGLSIAVVQAQVQVQWWWVEEEVQVKVSLCGERLSQRSSLQVPIEIFQIPQQPVQFQAQVIFITKEVSVVVIIVLFIRFPGLQAVSES